MEPVIAGAVACLLTVMDLDRSVHVPATSSRRWEAYAWLSAFVLLNGALAIMLFRLAEELGWLAFDIDRWLKAAFVGLVYPLLIHLKWGTLRTNPPIPLGIELGYEWARQAVYSRIDAITVPATLREARALAEASTLDDLLSQARMRINLSSVSEKEREEMTA
jgi:hypothetical protein